MRYRSGSSKFFAMILATAMVAASAAAAAPAGFFVYAGSSGGSGASADETPWHQSIPEMLEAGEYEEGVVVAGIDSSKAKRRGDPVSALETGKLREGADELISVDTENAAPWLDELKDKAAGQKDDGICIVSIRRDDMTTEQILKLLASDDSIAFAEPNYITGTESLNGGDDDGGTGGETGTPPETWALLWQITRTL